MALEKKTWYVLSYCDDLDEDESSIPSWLNEASCGSFVEYSISNHSPNYSAFDWYLVGKFPELVGEKFLIEMDY